MVVGLIVGIAEYYSIMSRAESSIHEIFAIATAVAYFTGFYILGRVIEDLAPSVRRASRRSREQPGP